MKRIPTASLLALTNSASAAQEAQPRSGWIDWHIVLNVILAILILEAMQALGQLWAQWVRRSFFHADPPSSDNGSS